MISRFGLRPAGAAIGAVRLSVVALPLALGAGVLAPVQAMAAARSAPSPTPGQLVKFYVVAPSAPDGQQEFLFEIAQRTLRDGNRFGEIFNLTKGRLQPDGQRLTDPTRIEPGWVLILPDDASGPDVRQGRIPVPATPRPQRTGTNLTLPLTGAGTAGVVLLAGTAMYVRRRRRRATEPDAPATGAGIATHETAASAADLGLSTGTDAHDRHRDTQPGTPAIPAAEVGVVPREAGVGSRVRRRRGTKPGAPAVPAIAGGLEPAPLVRAGVAASPQYPGGPYPIPVPPDWDVPLEPPATEPVQDVAPTIVIRDVGPDAGASATDPVPLVRDRDVLPRTAGPAVVHEVSFGDDLVTVAVTDAAATAWRPLPHDAPGGRAVVCVGAAPQGCLFVDLGTAPGTVAIAGPAEAAERLAEAFVSQLATDPASTSIALVGDALEVLDGGPGVRRVPDLGAAAAASTPSDLVIAFVPAGYDSAGRLGGAFGGPRVVQVRLGAAEDAAWSLTVVPDRAPRAWQSGE